MTESPESNTSRRRFLGGALGAVGAVAAGGAGGFGVARATEPADAKAKPKPTPAAAAEVAYYAPHQAGIATPAQDRLVFAAFDVTSFSAQAVTVMLASWAAAASQWTKGLQVGSVEANPQLRPYDTGEALGLGPSDLTITVGFGASFFDSRFGLAKKKPAALIELPHLPGDALQKERTGGDICVQACSSDPTVAFHVIRNFARLAAGTAVLRWTQLGFGRTSSTSKNQQTERNLMGFKDGTNNIKDQSATDFDDYVWVGDETDQPWMKGGSYVVARRIRMLIEAWDGANLADQETTFGRKKDSGAPLTGTHEFDTIEFNAKKADGHPVINERAHIRLASPQANDGQMILRRGYSYTDGIDATTGLLDAGLFFIAYQKDARKQFIPIQTRLGMNDKLNEYIRHTGSGLFAVPPGLSGPGDWWAKSIFE